MLSNQSNCQLVYCQIIVPFTSNVSACDWVCNLCTLDARLTTDSTNFAQGQRWRLILKGKSLVTCVQRGSASWQCDLPPSASDSHQRINHCIWQHCHIVERLGIETPTQLTVYWKKRCSNKLTIHSPLLRPFTHEQNNSFHTSLESSAVVWQQMTPEFNKQLNCVTELHVRKGLESWLSAVNTSKLTCFILRNREKGEERKRGLHH